MQATNVGPDREDAARREGFAGEAAAGSPPNVADLLAAGLRLPPLPDPPRPCPPGAWCCVSGVHLAEGYPAGTIITAATGEFLDTFRGRPDGWLSDAAARLFKASNPRAGNLPARSVLAFAGGELHLPLASRAAARAQGRPCWSDLVRAVWPARAGRPCVAILTTNTKKRLWPRARTGALGARTPLYLHDGDASGVRWLDWPALLACLDLVEAVYADGYSKRAIAAGLPGALAADALDPARALALERALRPWRTRPEFAPALLIAQRPDAAEADAPDEDAEDEEEEPDGDDVA